MNKAIGSRAWQLRARNKDEVYVAGVPLRATKGPPQLIMSLAYHSLSLWDLQHFIVIVKPPSPPSHPSEPLVFDFQPKDPENLYTALVGLSGREVQGVIFERKLMKLPRRKCWFVGHSKVVDTIDATRKFNDIWDTNLKIGSHDCRDYTNGLVEYLTGEQCILEHLRKEKEM